MRYFLGVDVGATKTHALIATDRGQALALSKAGPGNHQGVGYDGLRAVLQETVTQALQKARLSVDQIAGAGFGLGGYDWPSQLRPHLEVIATLGLTSPVELANDSIIALMAGASKGWGVVLIAGTGNNCRGRDQHGREARITGEGSRFGEFGGAAEMVARAVQSISYDWTRRGPRTDLTRVFIEMTGAADLDDLIEGIDLDRFHPDASWAPAIFEAASRGDAVAREIIDWSARESGESACAVIRQLGIEKAEFDVILAGRVFEGGQAYIDPLRDTIHRLAPRARLRKLDAPPVVGGVILGMQRAGIETAPVHEALIASTRCIVAEHLDPVSAR